MTASPNRADISQIQALDPVNKDAMKTMWKGTRYFRFDKNVQVDHWDIAPETSFIARSLKGSKNDITGIRNGRLVVVGLLKRTGKRARWLVRCDCSKYTVRSHKAMLNNNNISDRCCYCKETQYRSHQATRDKGLSKRSKKL